MTKSYRNTIAEQLGREYSPGSAIAIDYLYYILQQVLQGQKVQTLSVRLNLRLCPYFDLKRNATI